MLRVANSLEASLLVQGQFYQKNLNCEKALKNEGI